MLGKGIALPFRFFGVPVFLDWSLFLALPFFALIIARSVPTLVEAMGIPVDPEALSDPQIAVVLGILGALGIFASVLIHELGHSVVALAYGLEVKSITLWLLGGMARLGRMPKTRGVEAVVAIVGPITSAGLAGLCKLMQWVMPESVPLSVFLFAYLTYMNLAIAIFNLVPALPLDGGRVLRSLLAIWMSHLEATRVCVMCSRFVCFFFGVVGVLTGNLILLLVAGFVFLVSGSELAAATIDNALRKLKVRDLMTVQADTVPESLPVGELGEQMLTRKHLTFPVVDDSGRLRGVVSSSDLRRARAAQRLAAEARVSDVMSKRILTCMPTEPASKAWDRMIEERAEQLSVVDEGGCLVGVLSRTDIARAIEVRAVSVDGETG